MRTMTLTKKDFEQIGVIVQAGVIKETIKLEEEIADLKEQIKLLPTKEEFFDRMDKVMHELAKMRDEQVVIAHRTSDHGDRLEKLEEIHPSGRHSTSEVS